MTAVHPSPLSGAQFPEIHKQDLSTPDGRRSRAVTPDEFQRVAARGAEAYKRMARPDPANTAALDKHFDRIVHRAHSAAQEPWGGLTLNPKTGRSMRQGTDAYALTVRPPSHPGISVPAGADKPTFHAAMQRARSEYGEVLTRQNHRLGVFHDADKGTVDIDPVLVVKSRKKAEEIGAYTRNVGGAYHFKSGDGFWPPHVKD